MARIHPFLDRRTERKKEQTKRSRVRKGRRGKEATKGPVLATFPVSRNSAYIRPPPREQKKKKTVTHKSSGDGATFLPHEKAVVTILGMNEMRAGALMPALAIPHSKCRQSKHLAFSALPESAFAIYPPDGVIG